MLCRPSPIPRFSTSQSGLPMRCKYYSIKNTLSTKTRIRHQAGRPQAAIWPPGFGRGRYNSTTIMKRTDLSTIMRRAWALFRVTGNAFAVCLSKAWKLYRMTCRMRYGIVRFTYKKVDGTLRNAVGTLRDIASTVKGPGLPGDGRTVKYYDVEASGWRSFKVGNIVTIY